MITSETFSKRDHKELLDGWFKARQCDQPPWEMVAPTGVVINYDKKPICAGFLAKTDAKFSIMTNFISDPNSDKEIRGKCVEELIHILTSFSDMGGFKMICISTPFPSVAEKFKKAGYKVSEDKFINLGRT